MITIVDAVIAGQGEGPLSPRSKLRSILYGGFNDGKPLLLEISYGFV